MQISHIIEVSCTFDVENFPYDEQYCTINYNPAFDDASQVAFTIHKSGVQLDFVVQHDEWDIIKSNATVEVDPSDSVTQMKVNIVIRRIPKYYIYTICIPSVILALLGTVIFMISPTEDRVATGV